MTTQSDLDMNPAIFIGIAKDLDLGIDKDENLLIVKRNNWGVSDERTYLGPASQVLIGNMIFALQRLKAHAIVKISAQDYEKATGRAPENDDLDRANCPKAGELGHYHCGWNQELNLPRSQTKPFIKEPSHGHAEPDRAGKALQQEPADEASPG